MQLSAPLLPFDPTSLLPAGPAAAAPELGMVAAGSPPAADAFGQLLSAEISPAPVATATVVAPAPSPFSLGATIGGPCAEGASGSALDAKDVLDRPADLASWLAATGTMPATVPAPLATALPAAAGALDLADLTQTSTGENADGAASQLPTSGQPRTPFENDASETAVPAAPAPGAAPVATPVSTESAQSSPRAQSPARQAQVRAAYARPGAPRAALSASTAENADLAATAAGGQGGVSANPPSADREENVPAFADQSSTDAKRDRAAPAPSAKPLATTANAFSPPPATLPPEAPAATPTAVPADPAAPAASAPATAAASASVFPTSSRRPSAPAPTTKTLPTFGARAKSALLPSDLSESTASTPATDPTVTAPLPDVAASSPRPASPSRTEKTLSLAGVRAKSSLLLSDQPGSAANVPATVPTPVATLADPSALPADLSAESDLVATDAPVFAAKNSSRPFTFSAPTALNAPAAPALRATAPVPSVVSAPRAAAVSGDAPVLPADASFVSPATPFTTPDVHTAFESSLATDFAAPMAPTVDAPATSAAPASPLAVEIAPDGSTLAAPLPVVDPARADLTLLSVSTTGAGAAEKFADAPESFAEVSAVLEKAGLKKSVVVEEKSVTKASAGLGTNVAKTRSNMPVLSPDSPRATIEVAATSPAIPVAELATRVGESVPAQPEAAPTASAARRTVESVLAITDHFTTGGERGVNLKFSVSGIDLAVRVEVRAGTVQATFRTDSPELRAALATEWRAVAADAGADSRHLAEPIFTHAAASSRDALSADAGASDQRGSGARQEPPPSFAEAASPRFSGRRVPAFTSAVTAPVSPSLPAAAPGRLHVLA